MLLNQDGWRSTYCVDLPMNFAQNLVMFREVIEAMLVCYSATKASTNITPAKQEPYFLISERKKTHGLQILCPGFPPCMPLLLLQWLASHAIHWILAGSRDTYI